MAVQVEQDLLIPGDIIRFDFTILVNDEDVVDNAIEQIKTAIYSDDRLDYQSSEHSYPVDLGTGETSHILSVYAKVRKYRRSSQPELQEASIGAIAIAAILGMIVGALAAWSSQVVYKTYAIVRVTENPDLSADEKKDAIAAIQKTFGLGSTIAGGIAGAGTSIGILVALGLGGWLVMTARRPRYGSKDD